MVALSTTQLSSKGQVVIPEEIRKRLGLRPGSRFVVMAHGGAVILKSIEPPSRSDFAELLKKAHAAARRAGVRRSDVAAAIRKVRGRR